jgi:hypothetical protein
MRALITLFIVLSCGAAAMVISSRASKAVDAKTGTGAASMSALELEAFVVELCVAGGETQSVELTKSGLLKFTGLGGSIKLQDADRSQLQTAFGQVPSRLWRESVSDTPALKRFNDSKAAGGDFYYVTLAGGRTVRARADGWRASDLDVIKSAIWQVIRRRQRPALETDTKILRDLPKGDHFVEPYETLRNALRIKF